MSGENIVSMLKTIWRWVKVLESLGYVHVKAYPTATVIIFRSIAVDGDGLKVCEEKLSEL